MAMKVLLEGSAGIYRIRGAIWEAGSFNYRVYVHLVPESGSSKRSGAVIAANAGLTLQDVLHATGVQVRSTLGAPVERLEVLTPAARMPEPEPLQKQQGPR